MENSVQQPKGFFQRPEGKTGKVFIALIAVGAAIGLYLLLPFIITLLQNTLHAMLLLGAIAFLLFLVTNKKVRMLVSYGFQSFMRYITGVFVELNPIRILRIHIDNLTIRREGMKENMDNLAGSIRKLERKIASNKDFVKEQLTFTKSAVEKGTDSAQKQAWLAARRADRRRQSTIKFGDLLERMKKIYELMLKMHDNLGFFISDLTDDVDFREEEYKMVKESYGALKSAESILQGNPDERAMFELALEKLEENVSLKLGTMDRIMDMSEGFIETMDIEKGVMAEDGLLMLEQFEQGAFDDFFKEFDPTKTKEMLSTEGRESFNKNVATMKNSMKNEAIQKNAKGKYF